MREACPYSMGGCKILEINPPTILKVGYTVHMGEVDGLCLLRKGKLVPIPQIFTAYMIEDIGFILMVKVPGVALEKSWEDLPKDAKRSIVQQLQCFIQEWRKTEEPCFGSIDGGQCEDIFFKHSWDPGASSVWNLFDQQGVQPRGDAGSL